MPASLTEPSWAQFFCASLYTSVVRQTRGLRNGLRGGDSGRSVTKATSAAARAATPLSTTSSCLLGRLAVGMDGAQSCYLLGDASSLVLTQLALHLIHAVDRRPRGLLSGVVQRLALSSPVLAIIIIIIIISLITQLTKRNHDNE